MVEISATRPTIQSPNSLERQRLREKSWLFLLGRTWWLPGLGKAVEGYRSPKPGGISVALLLAPASWTAVALYRFFVLDSHSTSLRFFTQCGQFAATTIAVVFSLLLASLTSVQARPACILLLRHAEKPPEQFIRNLDDRGRARSQALASLLTTNQVLLVKGPIFALFAPKFTPRGHSRRPYETLEPLSQNLNIPIQTDFGPKDYADLASQVLKDPALDGKTIVICWVHDELPELARKLGVKPQPPAWDGKVFDRVWMITYRKNRAILEDLPQALMPGDSNR